MAKVDGNIKDLSYVAWILIEDDVVVSLLTRALGGRDFAVFYPNEEAFMAFLGTQNGVGPVYLRRQHKLALGFKTFSRVCVGWDWDDDAQIHDLRGPRGKTRSSSHNSRQGTESM